MSNKSSPKSSSTDLALLETVCDPGVEEILEANSAFSSNGTVSRSIEEEIIEIEQRLESLRDKPIDSLLEELKNYAKEAVESASAALSAAQHAIVYAWATGCVFNLAKETLVRGSFGKWRDAKPEELGMSVRNVLNWMKLAKDCWEVRALLAPGASLTSAYRLTGVLPQVDRVSPGQDDDGILEVFNAVTDAKPHTVFFEPANLKLNIAERVQSKAQRHRHDAVL